MLLNPLLCTPLCVLPVLLTLLAPPSRALPKPDTDTALEARLDGELKKIRALIGKIAEPIDDPKAIENAQVLYFLEANLETWKEIDLDCKQRELAMKEALERSATREGDPGKLGAPYQKALRDLLASLCP
jgi:hypothetical protein